MTTPVSWERLTEALYTVRRKCRLLPVLAIPWIHPKHPIHPVQEEIMHGGVSKGNVAAVGGIKEWVIWQIGRYLLHTARLVVALVRMRWSLRREILALKGQRFDVVAKTWCFGPEQSAGDRDFYYGDMQRRLADRGVQMLLLCGDASGTDREVFARAQISTSGLCRFPELCLVPLWAPVWMAVKQVGSSLQLWLMKVRERDVLLRRVYGLASRDCLYLPAEFDGLFFWIGRVAVKTWHPHAFLTLYEGHGWEKCAWWGVKTSDASCKTVGYQHTAIHDHNFSLLRPHNDQSVYSTPDVVLCLGERTRSMMWSGHLPRKSQLITFGSFRRSPANELSVTPKPSRRIVLVLPEGVHDEAKLLFNSAMQVAGSLSDHHFIFRCHPVLPFAQMRRYLEFAPENFPNIEISNCDSIAEDFARSSVVLYRGSSSVLYAILHGLKPIYLDDHHHDVDPLFELTSWREWASSASEMISLLQRYATTSGDYAFEQWRVAAEYVSAYATPVNDQSIDRFLAMVNLPEGGREL